MPSAQCAKSRGARGTKSPALLCLFISLLTGRIAPTTLAADPAPSNTIRAVRVIHFDTNPQKRAQIISEIAEGAQYRDVTAAIASVLGVSSNQIGSNPQLNANPITNEITMTIDVSSDPRVHVYFPPRAAEAADAAVAALIQDLTPPGQQDLKWSTEKRDDLTAQKQAMSSDLRDLENQLRTRSGAVDVSADTIHQLLASLQTQRESLSLDLVAKQARAEALTEQIAKFSDQLAKKVGDDPVATELEKVVELHQKEVDHLHELSTRGLASQADSDKANTELAEARAKLLERKSLAASTAGGDTLAAWNRELMNLSVDQAELNARLKAINDRLDRLANAGDMLDRVEQLRARLADISKQLADADARVADLQFHADRDRIEFKLLPDKSTNEAAPTTQPQK